MKLTKRLAAIALLLALAVGLLSCAARPRASWLVLYAFSDEGQLLRTRMTEVTDATWAGRSIAVGYLEGKPIILAESGMGTTNAAIMLQYILDRYPVRGVLFTGICGGISERNKIGDTVIPERWITHDFGYTGAEGFQPDSLPIGLAGSEKFAAMLDLPVDSQLFDWIEKAAYAAAEKFQLVVDRIVQIHSGGVGVTGNQFIDQVEKRQWLAETFNAEIVDMESAAVLQTALANGVPCVIIRSASDLAGGSGSATAGTELREFFQIAADNSAAVVTSFFRMLHERKFEHP
jgi:adenosylhomocysteine nucleosidase